jgi:hypothetical protein
MTALEELEVSSSGSDMDASWLSCSRSSIRTLTVKGSIEKHPGNSPVAARRTQQRVAKASPIEPFVVLQSLDRVTAGRLASRHVVALQALDVSQQAATESPIIARGAAVARRA